MKGMNFIEPLHHMVVYGIKSVTRRIMNPQPDDNGLHDHTKYPMSVDPGYDMSGFWGTVEETGEQKEFKPRYKVGETVFLKEPYSLYVNNGETHCMYKYGTGCTDEGDYIWQNKLFMPAKYARYFIEITGVRAERLQDISDEDCIKEGIYLEHIETNFFHYHDHTSRCYCVDCEKTGRKRLIKEVLEDRELFGFDNEDDDEWIKKELDAYSVDDHTEEPITCDICGKTLSAYANDVSDKHFIECSEAYADLIGHINGKGTWESNPYVFVYDFKLIK